MERKLMALAWGDMRGARFYLNEPGDIAVSYAAYHLAQAVEKICVACLTELGVQYGECRTVADMAGQLPLGQDLLSEEWVYWLAEYSSVLYDWEINARYSSERKVTHTYVAKVYRRVDKLYLDVCAKFDLRDIENSSSSLSLENSSIHSHTRDVGSARSIPQLDLFGK